MEKQFQVTGMTCSACSAHVEKSVGKLEGIHAVQVNLLTGSMRVDYDESMVDDARIIRAVKSGGYGATTRGAQATKAAEQVDAQADDALRRMRIRLSVSLLFLSLLMYVSMGHMVGLPLPAVLHGTENAMSFALTQFLLTVPICMVNRKFFINGFRSLIHRAPNMDSLIAIGSGAALLYGIVALYQIGYGLGHGDMARVSMYVHDLYFESAGMILTLITVGKLLETRAKGKTSAAIAKLMDLAPKTATIEQDNCEIVVALEEVVVGDIVLVRPGQSVPVDGEIIEGSTAIDESALTGESIPSEKNAGDHVYGATLNKTGFIKFRASKVGDDTTLAQIIRLVEEAGASKAPIAKLADKVSGVFVPFVLALALLSTVAWLIAGQSFSFALSTGIAVLVISCPCALGLATPVAIMVGTGVGAEQGVLFKSAEALEALSTVKTVVLDKTGTVTQGHPRVTDVLPAHTMPEENLLSLALSLEQPSGHPLAEAIVNFAKENGAKALVISEFEAKIGFGVRAEVEGRTCLAGNARMMEEAGIPLGEFATTAQQLAEEGKTPLFFAAGKQLAGIIAVADVVKETSAQAIAQMKSMGLDVVMLTGDNARTASAIQKKLGIDKVVAEVLPQDKEREVRALQSGGQRVAMIGDGINDAPALARADVGIAIGAGTDVAIESADVVLMKSDLLDAVNAIRLSHQTLRNIRQNLFWAFFYNIIGIPVAAGVFFIAFHFKLSPMFGAAAMSLSSFCVVMNALRLRFFKPILSNTVKLHTGKEEVKMTKTISIEGMMCPNCSGHVKKALDAIAGVTSAEVSHENGKAIVEITEVVANGDLSKAVEDAGYRVLGVE